MENLIDNLPAWAPRILAAFVAGVAGAFALLKLYFESRWNRQLEAVRTDLAKTTFVHQLQFEKEFQIYLELWEACVKLKRTMEQLRHVDPDFKNKNKRCEYHHEAKEKVKAFMKSHEPFYSPEVLKPLEEFVNVAEREHAHTDSPQSHEEENSRNEHQKEWEVAVNEIKKAIRARIWTN